MSRRTRKKKLAAAQLQKSTLARDHILKPSERQQWKVPVRRAPMAMPEVVYLRRVSAREVRHSADPEELAAKADYDREALQDR